MTATRRLYNDLADALRKEFKWGNAVDSRDWDMGFCAAVHVVEDALKRDNANFNREKFAAAVFAGARAES